MKIHLKSRGTSAQDSITAEINDLRACILHLQASPIITQDFRDSWEKERKPKALKAGIKRSQTLYNKEKNMLKRAAEKLEEEKELERFANSKVGRPGVIDCLKKIVESNLAGTDSRRRCEIIRTVRTLDDLKIKVEDEGYIISRSGLYYQLLPKNPNGIDGRRHHSLLKVRLLRVENNLGAIHPDRDYCFQLQLMIQDLVKLFGKQAILLLRLCLFNFK